MKKKQRLPRYCFFKPFQHKHRHIKYCLNPRKTLILFFVLLQLSCPVSSIRKAKLLQESRSIVEERDWRFKQSDEGGRSAWNGTVLGIVILIAKDLIKYIIIKK